MFGGLNVTLEWLGLHYMFTLLKQTGTPDYHIVSLSSVFNRLKCTEHFERNQLDLYLDLSGFKCVHLLEDCVCFVESSSV